MYNKRARILYNRNTHNNYVTQRVKAYIKHLLFQQIPVTFASICRVSSSFSSTKRLPFFAIYRHKAFTL